MIRATKPVKRGTGEMAQWLRTRPRLGSQHSQGGSQTPITPVPDLQIPGTYM